MSLTLLFFQSRAGAGLVTTCEIGGSAFDGAGGGDFYAGLGDHRLVIEKNRGRGGEKVEMKNEDFTLFYF